MRTNPSFWIYDEIIPCCERYYNWDKASCISKSGGAASDAATNKWYVSHEDEVCQQDCLGENGGSCGGLVPSWKVLYDTPASCCENTLSWIAPAFCEATSNSTTFSGTEKWYADYQHEKCVQDCATSTSATCGGLLMSASVDLFDTVDSCCSGKLGWVGSESCQAESTNTALSSSGSSKYYASQKLQRCVQDCVGSAPCGGLAESWDEVFTSSSQCCQQKLWWLERSACILT